MGVDEARNPNQWYINVIQKVITMNTAKKKHGRPRATDQLRDKWLVMRVSEKEREAILRQFRTVKDLRDYLLEFVRDDREQK